MTNENGENQLIQVSSNGQAQFIQLPNADGGTELFQISSEPPAELLDESEESTVIASTSEEVPPDEPETAQTQEVNVVQVRPKKKLCFP